jgi:integrase/recombinase XerC/integrase/recombinase XerD
VATHYRILRTFFNWLVAEEELSRSPLHNVAPPVDRPDQIQPFNADQIRALLDAAEKSTVSKRNVALLSLLLDTGLRATEICTLRYGDVDVTARSVEVLGKGNKRRKTFYGANTARALWRYIKAKPRNDADPLFQCQRGKGVGQGLTIAGLHQMIAQLGRDAGIRGIRCSPHTCRHTFAIMFLRAGGNEFTLQEILGHTSLTMTRRYVHLAEADVAAQSRRFSPMDALNRK